MKSIVYSAIIVMSAAICIGYGTRALCQTHGTAGAGPANTGNSQGSASPNMPNNPVTGQPGAQSVPIPGTVPIEPSAQRPAQVPPALQNPPNPAAQLSPNIPLNSATGQPGSQSVPMPSGNALQNQPNAAGSQPTSPTGAPSMGSPNIPPNSATGRSGAQSVTPPGTNTLQTQPNNAPPFGTGNVSPFGPGGTSNGLPAAQRGTNNQSSNLGESDIPPPVRNRVDENRAARQDIRQDRQELREDRRDTANDWRFSNYNNEWWYWMPENYWMYYRDNNWNRYDAAAYRPQGYVTGYRGQSQNTGTYYDENGRQYRRDYSPLRSALRRAEENGNAQVDINAGGTHVDAGPNGVQVGTPTR
ncbi:MAG TPA: hypothetical protein VFE46_09535 [Pirellulales bacterium]|nr:hypothetical protein [Pirellulales bacterium]